MNKPSSPTSENADIYQQKQNILPNLPNYSDDEIDLRELFLTLWHGKWIIIATTVVFAVGAVIYALTAQEWWSAKAKIAQPEISHFTQLRQQVMRLSPVLSSNNNKELTNLIMPQVLLKQFIYNFNASNNKRVFFDNNYDAIGALIAKENEKDAAQAANIKRKLYQEWYSKIAATAPKKNENNVYDLSLQAMSQSGSKVLLEDYINQIKWTVRNDVLNNLRTIVDTRRVELRKQKQILQAQVKDKLSIELLRSEYAYDIASAASLNKPIENLGVKETFAIDLGADALGAKIGILKNIKNLAVIEPRLAQIDNQLNMLDELKIDPSIEFELFQFLEDVELPVSRDKPKRALIVVLGMLLGVMLGIAIVLVRFAFKTERE